MAHSLSAKKRIRQDEARRIRNKSLRSELKTLTKKLKSSIESQDKETASSLFKTVIAKLDRAGQKRIYHPNNVARKKSTLTRLYNTLS